jgi:hypothetical protein
MRWVSMDAEQKLCLHAELLPSIVDVDDLARVVMSWTSENITADDNGLQLLHDRVCAYLQEKHKEYPGLFDMLDAIKHVQHATAAA